MIALFRDDYYQMGYLGPKGHGARISSEGVERFRQRVAALRPDLADRVDSIRSLDDLHWLDVRLDRLRRWYVDGLLASATPPTPCPRRAAWVSTWPSRTPSRQRPGWRRPSFGAGADQGPRCGATATADAHRRASRPSSASCTGSVFVPLFAGTEVRGSFGASFMARHFPVARAHAPPYRLRAPAGACAGFARRGQARAAR